MNSFLNSKNWFYLSTGINDGLFNMYCDNYLFNLADSGLLKFPLLRFYGWNAKTISLGVSQTINEAKKYGLPIVKRITGGLAVLHGTKSEELTYSIFVSSNQNFRRLYIQLGEVFINFLNDLGLNAGFGYDSKDYKLSFDCFESKTVADIVSHDIKIIGSAQYRTKSAILQHGSIRLDRISSLLNSNISFEHAIEKLKKNFEKKLNISFVDFYLPELSYETINKEVVFTP